MRNTLVIAGAGALVLVSTPAAADTGAAIGGILDSVIMVVGSLFGIVATGTVALLAEKFNLDRQSALYATVEETIKNGIKLAIDRAVRETGEYPLDFDGIAGQVLEYVLPQADSQLRKLRANTDYVENWARSLFTDFTGFEFHDGGDGGGGEPVADDE